MMVVVCSAIQLRNHGQIRLLPFVLERLFEGHMCAVGWIEGPREL